MTSSFFVRRRRWTRAASFCAVLLLVVIANDLTDASCDPVRLTANQCSLSAVPENPPDACGNFCVPDCFCCSPGVATAPVPPVTAGEILDLAFVPPPHRTDAGFRPLPEHVPIVSC